LPLTILLRVGVAQLVRLVFATLAPIQALNPNYVLLFIFFLDGNIVRMKKVLISIKHSLWKIQNTTIIAEILQEALISFSMLDNLKKWKILIKWCTSLTLDTLWPWPMLYIFVFEIITHYFRHSGFDLNEY